MKNWLVTFLLCWVVYICGGLAAVSSLTEEDGLLWVFVLIAAAAIMIISSRSED